MHIHGMKSWGLSELARYSGYLQPSSPQPPLAPSSSRARNQRNVYLPSVHRTLHAHPSLSRLQRFQIHVIKLAGSAARAHAKYIYTDRWKYQKDRRRKRPGRGKRRGNARVGVLNILCLDRRENIIPTSMIYVSYTIFVCRYSIIFIQCIAKRVSFSHFLSFIISTISTSMHIIYMEQGSHWHESYLFVAPLCAVLSSIFISFFWRLLSFIIQ